MATKVTLSPGGSGDPRTKRREKRMFTPVKASEYPGRNCNLCKTPLHEFKNQLDKFGNTVHIRCYQELIETYRVQAMFNHIRAGTGGYRQEQDNGDIYGGTG